MSIFKSLLRVCQNGIQLLSCSRVPITHSVNSALHRAPNSSTSSIRFNSNSPLWNRAVLTPSNRTYTTSKRWHDSLQRAPKSEGRLYGGMLASRTANGTSTDSSSSSLQHVVAPPAQGAAQYDGCILVETKDGKFLPDHMQPLTAQGLMLKYYDYEKARAMLIAMKHNISMQHAERLETPQSYVQDGAPLTLRHINGFCLDLHFLRAQEAKLAIHYFMSKMKYFTLPTPQIDKYVVITGRGKHSPQGRSVLKHVASAVLNRSVEVQTYEWQFGYYHVFPITTERDENLVRELGFNYQSFQAWLAHGGTVGAPPLRSRL